MVSDTPCNVKTAVFFAHPGHELKIHHFMETVHPVAHVLTDGSGGAKVSRLASTSEVLSQTDCRPGEVYGHYTDRELYRRLLSGDLRFFTELFELLRRSVAQQDVRRIVCDGFEWYNPIHDLANVLARCVAESTNAELYDFAVIAPTPRGGAIELQLDPAAMQRKRKAAEAYEALADEVAPFADKEHDWARESFQRRGRLAELPVWSGEKPFYEQFGEDRVAEGRYTTPIRYGQHVLPIFQALCAHVAEGRA